MTATHRSLLSINRRSASRLLCLAAAGLGLLPAAWAQAWPAGKPISLVVGYPAGGSVDLVARTLAEP